jgi:branched-chain amino acid aminotransferase
VSIMTHAFNYGTGCFEGIRAYWNEDKNQLYAFRLREHYQRLSNSARILQMKLPMDVAGLCDITLELVRRNDWKQDVYIRPICYKSSEIVGVRLHDLDDGFAIFTAYMGKYLDPEKGSRCCVSAWRRVDDNAIPARAKITGIYINSAFAKSDAVMNGYDEAIMLTNEGHVSEGSGENIFMVCGDTLVTPAPSENVLIGITRDTVIRIAREELGIPTIERQIDKSELYVADEVFMTGTAAEVTPIVEVDRRPVGDGRIGKTTARLQKAFFDIVRGRSPQHESWLTPVYTQK